MVAVILISTAADSKKKEPLSIVRYHGKRVLRWDWWNCRWKLSKLFAKQMKTTPCNESRLCGLSQQDCNTLAAYGLTIREAIPSINATNLALWPDVINLIRSNVTRLVWYQGWRFHRSPLGEAWSLLDLLRSGLSLLVVPRVGILTKSWNCSRVCLFQSRST